MAREVGTDGKLGGQAIVPGWRGPGRISPTASTAWRNLTAQVRNIAEVTIAVASGDLSKKITVTCAARFCSLKDTTNTMVDQLNAFAAEVTGWREVGTEGKLGGQAGRAGVAGTWKDLTDSVNAMASNRTAQVREHRGGHHGAVASGDLSKKITVDVRGEILQPQATRRTRWWIS